MSDIIDPPPAPSDSPAPESRQWGLFAHLSALVGLSFLSATSWGR